MGPTEALATFAVATDRVTLPADGAHAARRAILDCIGVTLAGSKEPVGRIITAQALAQGGPAEAVIWGSSERVSAQQAALANGTAAHALDYDDTNHSIPGHPSVPVLPAVLAMGERLGASGADVLAAFAVGVETECKVGLFTGQDSYDRGWHSTSTTGVIGAAVGAARLAGFDVPAMRQVIGLAVSQASGVRENFGTMTKPFHAGRAAQSGVLAVELVQRGFTASEVALEGPSGFWALYGRDAGRDPATFGDVLGRPFDLVSPGINFKAYPCCASTHAAIDAALQCAGGLSDEAIDRVVVDVPYSAPLILIHHRPETPLAAKFSLEYCVAVALLDGGVGLHHFTDTAVRRSDVQSLLRRVEYRIPDEWRKGAGPWAVGSARVEVRLKDGGIRRGATSVPRGDASNPLSDAELEAKFMECASLALGPDRAGRALDLIRRFADLGNVRELTAVLSSGVLR